MATTSSETGRTTPRSVPTNEHLPIISPKIKGPRSYRTFHASGKLANVLSVRYERKARFCHFRSESQSEGGPKTKRRGPAPRPVSPLFHLCFTFTLHSLHFGFSLFQSAPYTEVGPKAPTTAALTLKLHTTLFMQLSPTQDANTEITPSSLAIVPSSQFTPPARLALDPRAVDESPGRRVALACRTIRRASSGVTMTMTMTMFLFLVSRNRPVLVVLQIDERGLLSRGSF